MTTDIPEFDLTSIPKFEPSPTLLREAAAYVDAYALVIEPAEDGVHTGYARELPETIGDGETIEECARTLRSLLETVVASYLHDGQTPPQPFSKGPHSEHIDVRVSPAEWDDVARESARRGFHDVADFARAQLLDALHARPVDAAR